MGTRDNSSSRRTTRVEMRLWATSRETMAPVVRHGLGSKQMVDAGNSNARGRPAEGIHGLPSHIRDIARVPGGRLFAQSGRACFARQCVGGSAGCHVSRAASDSAYVLSACAWRAKPSRTFATGTARANIPVNASSVR
jgi:hypothetical protein